MKAEKWLVVSILNLLVNVAFCLIAPIKENTFYNLSIKNNNDIVYKDKVFCTNQETSTYTVNQNQYVANTTNNEFVIYE